MRRGEIWTAAGGKHYTGKPGPVVIVQDDRFDATDSITVCAFTTDPTDAPLFRLPVDPNERNGLRSPRRLMVDKLTTVPKTKLGSRVGRLDDEDILRLSVGASTQISAPCGDEMIPMFRLAGSNFGPCRSLANRRPRTRSYGHGGADLLHG